MRVLSIAGARPQFVKLAVMCRAMAARKGWQHIIVHTGQHYDPGLSDVFFEELEIPWPDYHLGVGSGMHGAQTGEMLKGLEPSWLWKSRIGCCFTGTQTRLLPVRW